jgi:hypothetical protein
MIRCGERRARVRRYAVARVGEAIDAALAIITTADFEGYVRHCGYTLHLG